MKQYLELLKDIRENGVYKQDRTGTGTYSVFGRQMRFDLSNDQLPLVTTKKTHLKSIIHELLWFLKGETNIRYLKENGVSIWDEWIKEGTAEYRKLTLDERYPLYEKAVAKYQAEVHATAAANPEEPLLGMYTNVAIVHREVMEKMDEDAINVIMDDYKIPREILIAGELGPVYGSQWRSWPNPKIELIEDQEEKQRYLASGLTYADWLSSGQAKAHVKNGHLDQISNLIDQLRNNPDSRRLIVSAWNPAEVDEMALPPCHCLFQFYTAPMTNKERGLWYSSRTPHEETIEKQAKPIWDLLEQVDRGEFTDDEAERKICELYDNLGVPRRKLSCQLYQRKLHCALIA